VKFIVITLIAHRPDPVTGAQKSTHERFREVLDNAVLAEELGFDGFGVGERHERPFRDVSWPHGRTGVTVGRGHSARA
jgi:alkanesulfonate monooxygenase SsuD/methylene tetrahydromethanopterin reductase-like flavin-dependent oxidoreductase (luciferase family)